MKSALKVFYAPNEAMAEINENPRPWIPFVLVVLLSLVVFLISFTFIKEEAIREAMKRIEELPPEQRDMAMKSVKAGYMMLTGIIGVIVMNPLKMLLQGLAFQGGLKFVGGDAPYNKVLSVVAHANLISVFGNILKLPVIVLTKSPKVHYDLAIFVSSMEPKSYLYRFLSQIDIFTIWSLFVLGTGLSVVGNVERRKAMYFVFGVWILYILLVPLIPFGR